MRLILVHGAWHSGACWQPVAELLRARGCTVLTPDLPGHGTSDVPLAKVTLKAYVDSIVALLDAAPEPVTLVGHSMAGAVVSEAAACRPDKVSRLVFLCAYLPCHGESLFDVIALNRSHEPFTAIDLALRMSDDKRTCTVDDEQILPLFYNCAPEAAAEGAKKNFGLQATLPLAAKAHIDEDALGKVKSTYILCAQDKVIPVHHQRRMLTRRYCDVLLQLDTDHSPFVSCPDQLALILQACVE
ncbi:MAG: alpha/beta hydrolase [Pseudomonadota bacterium]|nr:alpha/beta hydrolase [Pseudomonadota bacterium]